VPANKSHHYVPQMYMRLFSNVGGKRVGVFALSTGKFIPNASIKGQACKDYFYGQGRRVEGRSHFRCSPKVWAAASSC
jgi:hypothetical protein